jgi:23S rRNA pseudouridine2605 synthase
MRRYMRINKYLAHCGVASRRRADELIARGAVRVNGRIVRELGAIINDGDRVQIGADVITPPVEHTYLAVHKPARMVTTMRDPEGRRTIAQLVPGGAPRVVPVGRLDYDTTGILIMTDDGDLANRLLHPRFGVEKTYRATIAGRLSAEDVQMLQGGVRLGAYKAAGAKVRIVATRGDASVVDVTIHEGRNRQLRKMFETLSHPVRSLARLRFGPVALGDLPPGGVRRLTPRELAALRHAVNGNTTD